MFRSVSFPVSHPSPHLSLVVWQANEPEGSLLDEVRVEDPHLTGLPGDMMGHRLPEPICTMLREREWEREKEREGERWREGEKVEERLVWIIALKMVKTNLDISNTFTTCYNNVMSLCWWSPTAQVIQPRVPQHLFSSDLSSNTNLNHFKYFELLI